MMPDAHEQNRRSWNLATRAHNSHKLDQAGFLRAGGSTLFPDELALLGVPPSAWPDEHGRTDMSATTCPLPLAGRDLVHLQCNSGQDTLSLARLGARVTGVDISDEAVAFATDLAQGADLPATFIRSDVYDWLAATEDRFDVAFASYGVLIWLSDLTAWAAGVRRVLRPGGRLVLLEFHPLASTLDDQLRPAYPYFGEGRAYPGPDGIGDYVGTSGPGLAPMGWQPGEPGFRNPHPTQEFSWTIGDLLTAVLDAGLVLEQAREYRHANGCRLFADMRALPGRRFAMPPGAIDLPLMFGLVARRPA
jgi:SAM-dependent methyltransferase